MRSSCPQHEDNHDDVQPEGSQKTYLVVIVGEGAYVLAAFHFGLSRLPEGSCKEYILNRLAGTLRRSYDTIGPYRQNT